MLKLAHTISHYEGVDSDSAESLLALKAEYLLPCARHFYRRPPVIVRGQGAWLYDDTGKRYLDVYTGVTVMNAGHCNPAIIEPAIEQMRTLQHTTTIYLTQPMLKLAQRLAAIAPQGINRSFFCNSGSEATEGAMLAAMLHTDRPEIIAMHEGLHGRTRMGLATTGLPMWRIDPFPLSTVHHVPFGDADALAALLRQRGDRIAGIIAEPIQGNGGINVPHHNYWPAVRELCDKHGSLLIIDEVQTAMNRTGHWFACEAWGVQPDIIAMGKALGNGFPIGVFMLSDAVADSFDKPSASTFGGNPVTATAALATLDFHEKHQLGQRAVQLGQRLRSTLDSITRRSRHFGQPRGIGLMLGLPVVEPTDRMTPDAAGCDDLLESLKDHGVLVGKTGSARNVLTFLPPLTITDTEMGVLCDVLTNILA